MTLISVLVLKLSFCIDPSVQLHFWLTVWPTNIKPGIHFLPTRFSNTGISFYDKSLFHGLMTVIFASKFLSFCVNLSIQLHLWLTIWLQSSNLHILLLLHYQGRLHCGMVLWPWPTYHGTIIILTGASRCWAMTNASRCWATWSDCSLQCLQRQFYSNT